MPLTDRVLHWVFPLTCHHCAEDLAEGDPGPLCPDCREAVRFVPDLRCRRCGVPLPYGGAFCRRCRGLKAGACRLLRAAVLYGPEVRSLVHAFKYEARRHLARPLGSWMAGSWRRHPELHCAEVLVPVPLHPQRARERGFNQAAELALMLSNEAGAPVLDALRRVRATLPQYELGRGERQRNVSEAFACALPAVRGRKVLLVDDLATTGWTLEECARALRAAGAAEVSAFVLARQTLPDAQVSAAGPGRPRAGVVGRL